MLLELKFTGLHLKKNKTFELPKLKLEWKSDPEKQERETQNEDDLDIGWSKVQMKYLKEKHASKHTY